MKQFTPKFLLLILILFSAKIVSAYSVALSVTNPISCHGGSNGQITATIINGGGAMYTFSWSTNYTSVGQISSSIQNLSSGNYFLTVTDPQMNMWTGNIFLSQPPTLTFVNMTVTDPLCYGGNTGYLNFDIDSTTEGYTVNWSDNTKIHTTYRQNMKAGTYVATITTNGASCTAQHTFVLHNPPYHFIDLGADRKLCAGQTYQVDGRVYRVDTNVIHQAVVSPVYSVNGQNVTYQWGKVNGTFTWTNYNATLTTEGTYWIKATVPGNNCFVYDTIAITTSTDSIKAEFTTPTQGYSNQKIHLSNITSATYPADSVNWLFLSTTQPTIHNTSIDSCNITYSDPGTYQVGIKTYKNGCWEIQKKSITVVDAPNWSVITNKPDPFIKSFGISNNSGGNFTVNIELQDTSDIKLRLIKMDARTIFDDRTFSNNKTYAIQYGSGYTATLSSGIYALMLFTPNGTRVIKIQL